MNDENFILETYFLPWVSEGKKLWVAKHGQMGFVVYDPADQFRVKRHHIKLFEVGQSIKKTFEKKALLNHLNQIDSLDVTDDNWKNQIKEAALVYQRFSVKEREQNISDESQRIIDNIRESLPYKTKYSELRLNYPAGFIPNSKLHPKLLETVEWNELRLRFLVKCGCHCSECGDICNLQVHHRYYVKGKLPWDYPDDALVPLCEKCHSEFHGAVYEEVNGAFILCPNLRRCKRCGGTGYLPEFDYFENGKCFQCNGSGFEDIKGVVK